MNGFHVFVDVFFCDCVRISFDFKCVVVIVVEYSLSDEAWLMILRYEGVQGMRGKFGFLPDLRCV